MWPIYLLGLTWIIPQQLAVQYLTLILRSLGFSTFQTNLLTVPGYTLFILQLIFWTWISERINNRFLIVLVCQLYMLPLLIGLETLPAGDSHLWARYTLNIMLVGFPYVHAILGAYSNSSAYFVSHVVLLRTCLFRAHPFPNRPLQSNP